MWRSLLLKFARACGSCESEEEIVFGQGPHINFCVLVNEHSKLAKRSSLLCGSIPRIECKFQVLRVLVSCCSLVSRVG